MSAQNGDPTAGQEYQLVVTFQMDGAVSVERRRPAGHNRFPPGGGDRVQHITIAPVHLTGVPEADAAETIRKRSEALTLISDALAVANTQFADEVEAWARTQQPGSCGGGGGRDADASAI